MTRIPLLLCGLTVLGGAIATRAAHADGGGQPLDVCALKPVFMEEFDTLSVASRRLGLARWTAHTPWNGDFGDATFVDPGPIAPFSVADGVLSITARKGQDGRWRSGLIAASDASGAGQGVRFGYFEARMKMPPGPGTWPAFWLSSLKPAAAVEPTVELDVIEYYGHATRSFQSAVHVWHPDKARSRHTTQATPVADGALVEGFHTYGVLTAPDVLTFYFDRKPVWQMSTPPEMTRPLYPLVDLALGSGFSIAETPDPSVLAVDYVHVYETDPAGRTGRCPP